MVRTLVRRAPDPGLAVVEGWASRTPTARRLRAMQASREGDADALVGLMRAYTLTFGEAGLETSPHTLEQHARGTRALLAWANEHGVRVHRLSANDADGFRAALQVQGLKAASIQARIAGGRALVRALVWAGVAKGDDPFTNAGVADNDEPWATRLP